MALSDSQTMVQQVITMMKLDSGFADMNYVIGQAYQVPLDRYPLCEIYIGHKKQAELESGNLIKYTYIGNFTFSARFQDNLDWIDDIAVVQSVEDVTNWTDAITAMFKIPLNRVLQNVALPSGAVVLDFKIIPEIRNGERDRENTITNSGIVPFEITVEE